MPESSRSAPFGPSRATNQRRGGNGQLWTLITPTHSGLEGDTLVSAQAERLRQSPNGVRVEVVAFPSLQGADRVDAQAGALGQLLLG